MAQSFRAALAFLTALAMLSGIGAAFWYQDLQYSRPARQPDGWKPVPVGTRVALPPDVERLRDQHPGKPVHLHFFNPDCPCSRFNLDHVRQLVAAHREAVLFVAVLGQAEPGTLERAYRKLALDIPYLIDEGPVARAVGVYATPHAVILDGNGRLYYEGNYNLTRYCRDRETEFARLALEGLRAGAPPPVFEQAATVAYGCPLPGRRPAGGAI